jgi:aromatic-L-amino-acid/L-tryptophan decarboxylase
LSKLFHIESSRIRELCFAAECDQCTAAMTSLEITPQHFRVLAAQITEITAAYLSTLNDRPVFPNTSGTETERLLATVAPEHGIQRESLEALVEVLAQSRTQNGRFFGYVQGSADPIAALGDLVASVLNQNITAWRSSPAGVTIERTVVRWLAEGIGCDGFSGTLTGGGSAANLMALAMARESRTPANDDGLFGAHPCTIYASEQVHMSIPKTVAMLGLGRNCLRYIRCDDKYRMDRADLEQRIAEDQHRCKPIAIIASAGTVNTGSIDPLPELAAVARAHNLWMHCRWRVWRACSHRRAGKIPGFGSGRLSLNRSAQMALSAA